jgi:hypothetical protein
MISSPNVNPGLINPVYGCLIGGIPFKYQIMTIGFINPGLTLIQLRVPLTVHGWTTIQLPSYISKWLTSGSILDLLSQLFSPLAGWKVPRTSSRDEDFGCLTAEKSEARSPRSKMRLLSFRSMIRDQHTFNYYIIIYFLHDFWSFLWSFTYLDYCRTNKKNKKISWYRDYPGSIDPQTVYPPFSSMLFPYIFGDFPDSHGLMTPEDNSLKKNTNHYVWSLLTFNGF